MVMFSFVLEEYPAHPIRRREKENIAKAVNTNRFFIILLFYNFKISAA
jgi:hypothetical protein